MENNIKDLGSLSYFKDRNNFNYLYSSKNCFVGYEKKLTKQEKNSIGAKLIWKRKKPKKTPVNTLEKMLYQYADVSKDKFEMEWDFLEQLIKEAKEFEKSYKKQLTK